MRAHPDHIPILFFGIRMWGFPPFLIVAVPYLGAIIYLTTMTVIEKPWRRRAERIAEQKRIAEQRESATPTAHGR